MSILIEENDVTSVNLSLELERSVIKHILEEDNNIYVNEDGWFLFWVRVNQNVGVVEFRTHTHFKKSTTHLQRLEICNELNTSKYMLTACVNKNRLYLDYVINFRDGLLRETFVRSCRQFSKNIELGLAMTDPEKDFVLMPSQTESEDETGNA